MMLCEKNSTGSLLAGVLSPSLAGVSLPECALSGSVYRLWIWFMSNSTSQQPHIQISYRQLAKQLNLSVRHVIRLIKQLVSHKLLTLRQSQGDSGQYMPNTFTVIRSDLASSAVDAAKNDRGGLSPAIERVDDSCTATQALPTASALAALEAQRVLQRERKAALMAENTRLNQALRTDPTGYHHLFAYGKNNAAIAQIDQLLSQIDADHTNCLIRAQAEQAITDPYYCHRLVGRRALSDIQYQRLVNTLKQTMTVSAELINQAIYDIRFGRMTHYRGKENSVDRAINVIIHFVTTGCYYTYTKADLIERIQQIMVVPNDSE